MVLTALLLGACGRDDSATSPGSKGHTNGSVTTTSTTVPSSATTQNVMGRSTGG